MNISKIVISPIKYISNICKKKSKTLSEMPNIVDSRNILAIQNKVLVKAKNQVDPLQTEFSSTKELLRYSKKRCLDAINSKTPYEHGLVVDMKKNKILAEYVGDSEHCPMNNLYDINMDKENTVIIHGHPQCYPISSPDVATMMRAGVSQIVAFNPKGEFSLVATNNLKQKNVDKAFQKYNLELLEETSDLKSPESIELYNIAADYMLKKHSPLMGMRYVSNYSNLK